MNKRLDTTLSLIEDAKRPYAAFSPEWLHLTDCQVKLLKNAEKGGFV